MNKFFKRATAGFIAIGFAATTFTVNFPTAQAFGLGDLGKIGGDLLGIGNPKDLQGTHDKMLENFGYSIALLEAAYKNVLTATDDSIANKELIATEQAAKSAVKSGDAGTNMRNGADENKQKAADIKKYLADAVASGDEEKLKKIDEFIQTANQQRLVSDTMAGVAGSQAGIIIASSAKNLSTGNLGGIGDIVQVAQEVQAALKIRNDLSKTLNDATKEYRKTRSIKDPGKKECKAAADAIEKG